MPTVSQRSDVPTTALAKTVEFDDEMMHIFLADGRIITVPLIWFPLLDKAAPKQRQQYEVGGGGISLHCLNSMKICQLQT